MANYIGTIWTYRDSDVVEHHGIKGQKWGMRRFQNEDGTLTPEGKERYGASLNTGDKGAKKYLASEHGAYAFAKWRQRRHTKNIKKWEAKKENAEDAGKSTEKAEKKIAKYENKYEAQKAANDNMDAYRKHHSTGQLIGQNAASLALTVASVGKFSMSSHKYRLARARGAGAARAVAESLLPIIGTGMRFAGNKKAYGKYIVYDDMHDEASIET